jgi:putative endonuclease
MSKKIELGKQGEDIAFHMLVKKGYKILNRNWRSNKEEIDLVARDGDELVIVEVKTRAASIYEEPSESITPQKIRYLVNAAEAYIMEYNLDCETRFDVISIKWYGEGKYDVEHIENAFYPPVS